jgi:hypothetical protein
MQTHKANIYKPGRTMKYTIPDVMGKGMHIVMTLKSLMDIPDSADDKDNADQMEVENWGLQDEMEVDNDGILDV